MMKKILLALALVSATSLFADMAQWFNATPVPDTEEVSWSLNGEDGSVITNLTDTAYWEIDADVTKAGGEEATVFTPPALVEGVPNTITRVDISTTFDAMYDMSVAGEDAPQVPPSGSLGALVIGSVTNDQGVVLSSNFYAYVESALIPNTSPAEYGRWVQLGTGAKVPQSLTRDVVHVRIELLYLNGVNKLRYSIGTVDGSGVTNYVALAASAGDPLAGETLFDFTADGVVKNLQGVEFSGCGKVYQVASAVRTTEKLDGGDGHGDTGTPYLLASADTFLELALNANLYSGEHASDFKLLTDVTLPSWTAIGDTDTHKIAWHLFDGNGHTITINNLAGGGFFKCLDGSGLLSCVTISNLTIQANNVSVDDDAALFANVCKGKVKFVDCTAAGSLTSTVQNKKLAGFVCSANNDQNSSGTSITFENCVNEAQLTVATGSTVAPAAFVAEVNAGKVAATPDTTLVTVGGYDSYGTIVSGLSGGSVDCAFNFCTNDTINEVAYTFYVEPKLSPMNAETIPTYWIAKENADVFEFKAAGKLKLAYVGQKFTGNIPYDVANKLTATAEYVVEGGMFDDSSYTESLPPSFTDVEGTYYVCEAFVNPCVATTTWYGKEIELGVQKHSGVARAFSASYSGEGEPTRTVVALCAAAELLGGTGCSGEFELGKYVLTVAEDDIYSVAGDLQVAEGAVLNASSANPLDNIDIKKLNDPAGFDFPNNRVTFLSGAVVYGNTVLWLDSELSAATPTPAFARLASGASIIVTNVGDTHKDFLFDATGVKKGNSCATIYSFAAAGGNDTYTLSAGAIVTTDAGIPLATAMSKLRAVSGYKVVQSDPGDDHTFTTEESQGGEDNEVNINGETKYPTLYDALAAAKSEDVIIFLKNVSLATGLTVNQAVTLALGDRSLTIGDGSLVIDAAVTIAKGTGAIDGNVVVKAGASLTMAGVNPNDLAKVTYYGTESGATFVGNVTYNWIGTTWSTGERTFFGGGNGSEATPYVLSSAQHLFDLKDWAADNDTTGVYFKQEGNIDMAGIVWPGIGAAAAGKRFSGVYDGGNRTISNLMIKRERSYQRGLFAVTDCATIKNLTVETLGFDQEDTSVTEPGGGTLIGYVLGGTMISNVTTKGTLVGGYTTGGMVGALGEVAPIAVDGMNLTFVDCTNEVNVTTTKDKIGGFLAYAGYTSKTGVKFIRCVNKGTVTAEPASGQGNGGAAEFIGWAGASATQTFEDCVAQGSVTSTDSTTKVGTFIGRKDAGKATMATGTNVATASLPAIGTADATMVSNLSFATVDEGVATFVADDEFLAANEQKNYKVMSAGAPAIELESGEWTFDGSLFDTFGAADITASTDANINSIEKTAENKVVTVTVTPLTKDDGVFEVEETVDSTSQSGNIKITLEDAKKVDGFESTTSLAAIDAAAFQTALNATDTAGVPVWQKLVLGLAPDQKPTVKATQDATTDTVKFSLGTIKTVEQIRNTGAKVKFCLVGAVDGELKEVGETLSLPIDSLFQGDDKAKRIKVKIIINQANQRTKNN